MHVHVLHLLAVYACVGAWLTAQTGLMVLIADHARPKAGDDDGC